MKVLQQRELQTKFIKEFKATLNIYKTANKFQGQNMLPFNGAAKHIQKYN